MPRFQLMDDIQLQDLIDSADSKNTKYTVKYGIKIFEEFLRNVNNGPRRCKQTSECRPGQDLQQVD